MRFALLAVLLFGLSGCAGTSGVTTSGSSTSDGAPTGSPTSPPQPPIRVLPCNTMGSREATMGGHLLLDQASYEREWRKACSSPGLSPTPSVPPVNFSKESVLIYSWGQKPSGGYHVEIPGVRPGSEHVVEVTVRRVSAGSCPATAVITYPAQAVVIPREWDEATWNFQDETCISSDHMRPLPCEGAWTEGAKEARLALRTQEGFEAQWNATCAPRRVPLVDFSSEMVLFYAWGEKPAGGYGVEFTFVEVTDKVDANVRRTAPGDGCPGPAVMTYPVAFVVVKKSSADVTWTFEDTKTPC